MKIPALSIILPFYHKADMFRMMLPVNDCFRDPDTEVVLVLDEPSEEAKILDAIGATPDVRFRVIVNDWPHVWRPPCIAYNVGARHALADHLLLTDPETAIVVPKPNYLIDLIRADFRMCYAGITWLGNDFKIEDGPRVVRHKLQVCEACDPPWLFGLGAFLVPKLAFERVCGFDEGRNTYGFDDTDFRNRIVRLGYRCTVDGSIKLFHPYHVQESNRVVDKSAPPTAAVRLEHQSLNWGKMYWRCASDWRSHQS